MKLLIVANNCPWASWAQKIDELKNFFYPKVTLNVDIIHTKINNIPFVPIPNAVTNAPQGSTLLQVDPEWYDMCVTRLALGYDIVLLVVNANQWPTDKTPVRGARTDRDQGPVELQIAANENEDIIQNIKNTKIQSHEFQHFAEHEIMHALFMITGQSDTTHHWDYDMGNLAGALNDLTFTNMNNADKPTIIQKTTAPLTKPPVNNDLLNKMCAAIQSREGWW